MKILFIAQWKLQRELGGPKVVIELAEEMTKLGWNCELKSILEIQETYRTRGHLTLAESLRLYLKENAAQYDVVDYDHVYLPYSRLQFPQTTLLVARSVLLAHQLREIKIPKPRGLRPTISRLVRWRNVRQQHKVFEEADLTVKAADLVNVSNDRDREVLIRHGVEPDKIVVLPYGIDVGRRILFDAVSDLPPAKPKVVFVGTFDYRKGCLDLPKIMAMIQAGLPNTTFKLLGASGMYQTEAQIRKCFPAKLQKALEIVMRYRANELPKYLADCSVGIFPSYLEGFSFGVLEMLAAALPVYAYDAPGPSSILNREYLVSPGNTEALSKKVIGLLMNKEKLSFERNQARARSQLFTWDKIATETDKAYRLRYSKVSR